MLRAKARDGTEAANARGVSLTPTAARDVSLALRCRVLSPVGGLGACAGSWREPVRSRLRSGAERVRTCSRCRHGNGSHWGAQPAAAAGGIGPWGTGRRQPWGNAGGVQARERQTDLCSRVRRRGLAKATAECVEHAWGPEFIHVRLRHLYSDPDVDFDFMRVLRGRDHSFLLLRAL